MVLVVKYLRFIPSQTIRPISLSKKNIKKCKEMRIFFLKGGERRKRRERREGRERRKRRKGQQRSRVSPFFVISVISVIPVISVVSVVPASLPPPKKNRSLPIGKLRKGYYLRFFSLMAVIFSRKPPSFEKL